MYSLFYPIAKRLWPELASISEQRRLVGVGDVATFLLLSPFALLGLGWLVAATDPGLLRREWPALLLFGGLMILFNRLNYFFIVEIRADRYGSADGSLAGMIQWVAVLLFGPSALWLSLIGNWASFVSGWFRPGSSAARWTILRSLVIDQTGSTLAYLLALTLYRQWGGAFPLEDLTFLPVARAVGAQLVHFVLEISIWAAYVAYAVWVQRRLAQTPNVLPVLKFFALALGLPVISHPFAILLAGLYDLHGYFIFLFLVVGLLLVAYLARQLSWAAETSRQQSRQLEQLERLGRAIIAAPPDASALPGLMAEHVPMMFPSGRIAIWFEETGYLYRNPPEWTIEIEPVWDWVRTQDQSQAFLARAPLPWVNEPGRHEPVVLAPILDAETGDPLGCIYIELRSLSQPWDWKALTSLFPAVRTLAAQLASALRQAEIYAATLEYQSALQELAFAGRIQSSFLPNELPAMDGWELAVTLLPARETSGDFFDFIPLPEGKVGVVIADVADKGVGAALYMALSRTLIRTYALEYDAQPEIVFYSANERILHDARANLFVTAFYAVLDQESGQLVYANAGHNPPLLLSPRDDGTIHALTPTGMPLGIDEDATWTAVSIQIQPGDALVLYTDGIPDAQDSQGNFFKERRLIEVAQANIGVSAQEMQRRILDAVQDFSSGASQFDDITLLVILRDPLAPVAPETPQAVDRGTLPPPAA